MYRGVGAGEVHAESVHAEHRAADDLEEAKCSLQQWAHERHRIGQGRDEQSEFTGWQVKD